MLMTIRRQSLNFHSSEGSRSESEGHENAKNEFCWLDARFTKRYFPPKPDYATLEPEILWSCGPSSSSTMISRKKILSSSRDGLHASLTQEEEDDVWFQKDKLFKDHIQEVLNKWRQIDDEIWAKLVVMERNRRVAKAYARAPVLTINGSDDGFDGYRIGLCGFENPMRDAKTDEIKKQIGHGVKVKMDEAGNIMVKRSSKSNVYIKEIKTEENSISNDVLIAGGLLDMEKPVKVFDMKKFAANVNKEFRQAYPDGKKLESQCISVISFVKDCTEILDCPCWVMIINIVALDMLCTRFPELNKRQTLEKLRGRSSENAYSVPSSSFDGASRTLEPREAKPPKLPPRDTNRVSVPLPDYDDWKREKAPHRVQQPGCKDDPYYCGMRARVPNFARKLNPQVPLQQMLPVHKSHSSGYLSLLRQNERLALEGLKGLEENPKTCRRNRLDVEWE